MLFLHKPFLSNPDTMLTGRRPATIQCEMDNLLFCLSNLLPLCRFFGNPQNLHMEIAASCMAKGKSFQSFFLNGLLTPLHHVRIFRDGNSCIDDQRIKTRMACLDGFMNSVPRLPEAVSFLPSNS